MSFYYTNSQNKENVITDFEVIKEFKNKHYSYLDVSFTSEGYVRLNNKNIFTKNIGRDKFLKICEFPYHIYKGKKESLVLEITSLSEYINTINFYRYLDMLEKLIGISINEKKHITCVHIALKKLINPEQFIKNKKTILTGKINYNKLLDDLTTNIINECKPEFLNEYMDIINTYKNNPTDVFFRGVSTPIYPEQAGVFRMQHGKYEDKMFTEMVMRHPQHFKGYSTIEKLTDMQHFELKTRMLDITTNPLVALYMATNKIYTSDIKQKDYGEVIVYFADQDSVCNTESTNISFLANLARISYKDKQNLLSLINTFKDKNMSDVLDKAILEGGNEFVIGYKLTDILKLDDKNKFFYQLHSYINLLEKVFDEKGRYPRYLLSNLTKPRIVKVGFTNDRIRMQSGCFILFGLDDNYLNKKRESNNDIISSRIITNFPRIIIKNKANIFKELANYGINDSTMLPDLQHSASYITEKFK